MKMICSKTTILRIFFFSVLKYLQSKRKILLLFPFDSGGRLYQYPILKLKGAGGERRDCPASQKKAPAALAVKTGPCAAEAAPGMCSGHRLTAVLGGSCWHALPRARPAVVPAPPKCLFQLL